MRLKSYLKTFFCILIVRAALEAAYFTIVAEYWDYSGFRDVRSPETFMYSALSLLVTIPFIVPIIENKKERVSSLIVTVMYVLAYIPFTVMVRAGVYEDIDFIILHTGYWLILLAGQNFMLRVAMSKKSMSFNFMNIRLNDKLVTILCAVSIGTVLFISWRYTGFRLQFNILDVYGIRAEAAGYAIPIVLSYLLGWTGLINPIMCGYCLLNKRYGLALMFFCVQFVSFGIGAHKSVFFAPIVVALGVIFFKNITFNQIKLAGIWGTVALSIVGILENKIFSTFYIVGVFIRRMYYVPARLSYCYYDYFSCNEFDFFRSSFLRHFGFVSPYTEGISRRIGEIYNNLGNNANNGLFSDAFSNLGYIGVFVMPVVLLIVLYTVDMCTIKLNPALIGIFGLLITFSIINTSIFTVIMTHGMLAMCVVMILLKRDIIKKGLI